LSTHFPGTASHGMIATTQFIAAHEATVAAMVRAFTRGVSVLKSDRHRAVGYIGRRFKLDEKLAAQCYDLMREHWTASLSLDALRVECDFHARVAGLPAITPERIADARF